MLAAYALNNLGCLGRERDMDPVVALVVSALSAGALAIGQGFATEAIKDSYKALKGFLVARFANAAPFVEVVDKKPSETTADLLAEQIAPVAGDPEAEALAKTLRAAIEAFGNEPQADAVIKLLRSKTGDIEVEATQSS